MIVQTVDSPKLFQARTFLPHANILTLASIPVEIAPAPGAGLVVIPLIAQIQSKIAVDYTNIAAQARIDIKPELNIGSTLASWRETSAAGVSAILAPADPTVLWQAFTTTTLFGTDVYSLGGLSGQTFGALETTLGYGISLFVMNDPDGALDGGDEANYLIVNLMYYIYDMATQTFVA